MSVTAKATFNSPPQLSRKLLRELLENPIMDGMHLSFSNDEFDEARHNMAIRACLIDQLFSISNSDNQESFLHIASRQGDIPLAYEMIRLGASIDAKDTQGQTALFHALQMFSALTVQMEERPPHSKSENENPHLHPNRAARIKIVARLLIEQHADVNIALDRLTCLRMLFRPRSKDWELIELLIAHGARDDPVGRIAFKFSKAEQRHLDALFRAKQKLRPRRPCPCFSGKLVTDCHGKKMKPLPLHFLCPCQSGSIYKNCCKKRRLRWLEGWNKERGSIELWREDMQVELPLPQHTMDIISKIMNNSDGAYSHAKVLARATDMPLAVGKTGIPPEIENPSTLLLETLEDLSEDGLVDPAFAFAIPRARWNVRPLGRKVPKQFSSRYAKSFNGYVDQYIAKGRDPRNKLEIEIAAKIGPSCGALYRVCEADGCNKQEGRNIDMLKMCQACKLTVYCSVQCQEAHWKVHKQICCAPFQTEQPLPSQRVLQERLTESVVAHCAHVAKCLKAENPDKYHRLISEGVPEH
ncbi:hypothetical protein BD410DRAFT_827242 [Rickenella mellea]|uniref:MYND-type domain-containing protein n=1 Tax=Rickenella mellea TaxID=50990 RepID=A0A4Y7Q998_9AGAM|nr:hypothetical protein BD410DRAFT_827242 [Rickenella mellea]